MPWPAGGGPMVLSGDVAVAPPGDDGVIATTPSKDRRMNRLLTLLLAAAGLSLASLAAHAEQPASVLNLLNALPELPAGAEQTTAWVDKRSTLIHPGLLQLQSA